MPNSNDHLVDNEKVDKVLDNMKMEVAQELGLDDDIQSRGWSNMTTKEVGSIGGAMTKKLVKQAEEAMGK